MIVAVGGGTTEVAVLALGGMIVWQSLRIGGFGIEDAIAAHVKRQHGLLIGEERAEQVKIEIGSAFRLSAAEERSEAAVAGRDLVTGQLARKSVNAKEVRQAVDATIARILAAVKETLEQT